MQLDNILVTNTIFGAMICLLAGLTVIRVKAISLRSFQAIYLLLGAANVAFCYFVSPQVDILFPIAALAAGILLTFIAAGFFGRLNTSSHYETILVSVGLFPWYLGWGPSLIYIGAALVFCAITKFVRIMVGLTAVNYPLRLVSKISERLPEEKLATYRKKASVILTTPVGVAAVFSAVFYALQF